MIGERSANDVTASNTATPGRYYIDQCLEGAVNPRNDYKAVFCTPPSFLGSGRLFTAFSDPQ
jgi:hypothetical protein